MTTNNSLSVRRGGISKGGSNPNTKKRVILWRVLLRLFTVGTGKVVPSGIVKEKALFLLRELLGKFAPSEDQIDKATDAYELFASVMTIYTRTTVTRTDALYMFCNPCKRGYVHTSNFKTALNGLPWPPALAEGYSDGVSDLACIDGLISTEELEKEIKDAFLVPSE